MQPRAADRLDARRLQGCLNDMVGILALPAFWHGRAPAFIMSALLDGLLKVQWLELASITLSVPIDGAPREFERRNPRCATNGALRTASFRLGIGEEIGVLTAASSRPDFPTPTEVLLLQVAASQAAIGLQEVRRRGEHERAEMELERRVLERTADMTRLQELGQRLLAQKSLKDLLEEVLDATIELQNADLGSVQLYDDKEQALQLLAQRGFPAEFVTAFRYVRRDTPSSCGRALASGARVIVEDLETDPLAAGHRAAAATAGFRAQQSTPLFSRAGEILGMLTTHFRLPHRPGERELRLTDLYGRFAAELVERKQAEVTLLAAKDEAEQRAHEVEEAHITLRKVQEELARAARVTTLGELATSIAHEVNQPLAAAVANAQACLRWLAVQPPNLTEARAAVERVVRDSNRAADVVASIRAFVRRGETRKSAVDVLEAIREVVSLILDKATQHGVTVKVAALPRPPAVLADPVQLQQVFLNLAINAIEAMRQADTQPRVLQFDARESAPDGVLVAVRDSGPGLDAAQRLRIFEPFVTSKADGMGMGLAISRSIIEAHGGKLWAEPNGSGGECFQFTLPLAAP